MDRGDRAAARAGRDAGLELVEQLGGLVGRARGLGALAAVVVQQRLRPQRGVEHAAHALQPGALLRDLDVAERVGEVEPLLLELRAGDRELAQQAVLARGAGDRQRAVERRVAVLEALAEQRRGLA